MNEFEKITFSIYGQEGKEWLTKLPTITHALAQRWNVTNLTPCENLTFNYIVFGKRGTQDVALKIGLDPDEPREELEALQALQSPSVPRIFEHDLSQGAFLIERALPGDILTTTFPHDDGAATEIFCNLVQQLPYPSGPITKKFSPVSKWFEYLESEPTVPLAYRTKARRLFDQLLTTMPEQVVVHGDLHHRNILKHQDRWIAVDPLTVVAERAYDVAHFVWNPYPLLPHQPSAQEIIQRRILHLAEKLSLDRERILKWTFVRAVNAWSYFPRYGRDPQDVAKIVQLLDPLVAPNLTDPSPLFAKKASMTQTSINPSKAGLAYFESNAIAMFGTQGEKWLKELPQLVETLAAQWNLTHLEPLVDALSYNFILKGFRGEQPIILKISLDFQRLEQETQALRALAGPCAVQVLEQDKLHGALLLERAIPGNTLHVLYPYRDNEAIEAICNLIKNMPKALPVDSSAFHSDADRFSIIDHEGWDIPAPILEKARSLKAQLLKTAPKAVLIHGDMHDENIVQHENRWMVIDPSGMRGEIAHEVANFICNPYESVFSLPNAQAFLKNRILRASQLLDLDPERVQRWCYLYTVWVWTWFLKTGGEVSEIAHGVRFLDPLTPDDLSTPSPLLRMN